MNDTGGSAFPNNFGSPKNQGMTLRDYFAAKAMQGMIEAFGKSEGDTNIIPSGIASYAYGLADAMLKARDGNS